MAKIKFKNIAPKTSSDENDVKELMLELDSLIPIFVNSSIFERDIYEDSDEDHYTETLIKYLENEKPSSRFSFKPQATLLHRRSTDIAVHLKADSEHYIFNIEAKFLPPKDYVTGEYAAIKRFKCCQHGLSSRHPSKVKILPQNAIIAYSKSGRFEQHLTSINEKILKLSNETKPDKFGLRWYKSEKLKKIYFKTTAKLKSKHKRIDKSEVILHHFWVKVI